MSLSHIYSLLTIILVQFLEYCTSKLKLASSARRAFNYCGDEIRSIDSCTYCKFKTMINVDDNDIICCCRLGLQSDLITMKTLSTRNIFGPIWLSKSDQYSGCLQFLRLRCREYEVELRKVRIDYCQVMFIIKHRKLKKHQGKRNGYSDSETKHDQSSDGTDDNLVVRIKNMSQIQDKSFLSMKNKEIYDRKRVCSFSCLVNRKE
jgi:hypothetical protein